MTTKLPEELTLEEIREQLALYNRLYYQKRRHEKEFMETKRLNAIRQHRRKKLNELVEKGDIDLKDIDYDKKKAEEEEEEDNKDKVKKTKPRKYNSTSYVVIKTE